MKKLSKEASTKRKEYCNKVLDILLQEKFISRKPMFVDAMAYTYRIKLWEYNTNGDSYNAEFAKDKKELDAIFQKHNLKDLTVAIVGGYSHLGILVPFTEGWEKLK